jgi:hypothetical protein
MCSVRFDLVSLAPSIASFELIGAQTRLRRLIHILWMIAVGSILIQRLRRTSEMCENVKIHIVKEKPESM